MSATIDRITHQVGEDVDFALCAPEDQFTGVETLLCDIKVAKKGYMVPDKETPAVLQIQPTFLAAVGEQPALWFFQITAAQSANLQPGNYITDARVVDGAGRTELTDPLLIQLTGSVTNAV